MKEINCSNPRDERGSTFEWKLQDKRQITVLVRKKGSILGKHYHKGKDPSKNPDVFEK